MATATRAKKAGTRAAVKRSAAAARRGRLVAQAARVVECPDDLDQALRDDPAARKAYQAMPPSHQRAYVEFIEEAKRPETRVRRVQQALRMMAQWGAEHAKRGTKRR